MRPSINAASFIAVCGSGGGASWKVAPGDYSEGLQSIVVSSGATLSSGFTTQGAAILASGITNGPGTVLGRRAALVCALALGASAVALGPRLQHRQPMSSSTVAAATAFSNTLNAMRFGFTTGNIESGDFAVYGVKK